MAWFWCCRQAVGAKPNSTFAPLIRLQIEAAPSMVMPYACGPGPMWFHAKLMNRVQ